MLDFNSQNNKQLILATSFLIEWDTPPGSPLFIKLVDSLLKIHPFGKCLRISGNHSMFIHDKHKVILKFLIRTVNRKNLRENINICDDFLDSRFTTNIMKWLSSQIEIEEDSVSLEWPLFSSNSKYLNPESIKTFNYERFLLKLIVSLNDAKNLNKKSYDLAQKSLYLLITFACFKSLKVFDELPIIKSYFNNWVTEVKWSPISLNWHYEIFENIIIIFMFLFATFAVIPSLLTLSIKRAYENSKSSKQHTSWTPTNKVNTFITPLVMFTVGAIIMDLSIYFFIPTWILYICLFNIIGSLVVYFFLFVKLKRKPKVLPAFQAIARDEILNIELNSKFVDMGIQDPKLLITLLFQMPSNLDNLLPFSKNKEILQTQPLWFLLNNVKRVNQTFMNLFFESFSKSNESDVFKLVLLNWAFNLEVVFDESSNDLK